MSVNKNLLPILAPYFSLIHHIPGRIRMRIDPSIKSELKNFSADNIQSSIASINGIKKVKFNKLVGSVTIEYDHSLLSPLMWNELLVGNANSTMISCLDEIKGLNE